MRPVRRGVSPQAIDFLDYEEAKPHLVSRLGLYCSYCERRVVSNLAVEHIQPKGLPAYAALEGRWSNFLLACVNCNSTKSSKDVVLVDVFIPDRDNTFDAFNYLADGRIEVAVHLTPGQRDQAVRLLSLVGLDKPILVALDENGKQVALDRVAQRMEAWGLALEARSDVSANPGNLAVRNGAIRTAKAAGFFSIWMTVFAGDVNMRNLLIDAFPGTRSSGCFHLATTLAFCPAPNPDHLSNGSKL